MSEALGSILQLILAILLVALAIGASVFVAHVVFDYVIYVWEHTGLNLN